MERTLLLVIVAAVFEAQAASARSRNHPPPQAFVVDSDNSGGEQSPVQLLVPMVVVEDRSDDDSQQQADRQSQSQYLLSNPGSEARAGAAAGSVEGEEASLAQALGRVLGLLELAPRRPAPAPAPAPIVALSPRAHDHGSGELCPACLILHALQAMKLASLASALDGNSRARAIGGGGGAPGCTVCVVELQRAARRSSSVNPGADSQVPPQESPAPESSKPVP